VREQASAPMAEARSQLKLLGVFRRRPAVGYTVAAALVLLAFAARLGLHGALPPGFPFLTFYPAIILAAYLAGRGPALFGTGITMLMVWLFLLPDAGNRWFGNPNLVAVVIFSGTAVVNIVCIDILQKALDSLRDERTLTRSLYDQQRTLFEELQHRVANNLAFVSGLLRLQKRRILATPADAGAVFDEAVSRIETMGDIHRRLYDPAAANLALEAYLQAMCRDMLDAMGAGHIAVAVQVPGLKVPLDRLLPLSLLVAEIVTNSAKHGFAGRSSGHIDITAEAAAAGQLLVIRDDGRGLPDGHDPAAGLGLGIRIVQGLAAQLGGKVSWSSNGGTVARVALP
jgi:two-component sensor histidine kinase